MSTRATSNDTGYFLHIPARIWLLFMVLYGIMLTYGTHHPQPKLPDLPSSDKLLHFSAYAVFMTIWVCWSMALPYVKNRLIFGMVFLSAWGAVDELTQPYFERQADIYDWLMDVAGVLFVGIISVTLHRVYEQKKRHGTST